MPTAADLAVKTLAACRIDSPLKPMLEATGQPRSFGA
jgi:hypothetical protein